ncbi:hypothetical protein Syun_008998 [Stephania yunnanensis]|uniref:Retrotransposon Copia-like N-terminal domain-containing protein n=1 Tax=Stephania yunnanensis TaxID=152371 RepID=A0AAP0KFR7_9MAGN
MEEGQTSSPLPMASQPSQVTSDAHNGRSSYNSVITPFGYTLSQNLTIKLNLINYHVWKALILPAIKGNKFDGALLGTEEFPKQIDSETGLENLKFEAWKTTDKMLLS